MFSLVSRKFLGMRNIALYSVFCATDFKFVTKNNGKLKLSILKTLIFPNFDLRYQIEPNPGNIFMVIFIYLCTALVARKDKNCLLGIHLLNKLSDCYFNFQEILKVVKVLQ